jgi:hypothetical protein
MTASRKSCTLFCRFGVGGEDAIASGDQCLAVTERVSLQEMHPGRISRLHLYCLGLTPSWRSCPPEYAQMAEV